MARESATCTPAASTSGSMRVGFATEALVDAFDRQIRSVADQLSPRNAGSLVRIREGGHVSDIRRIAQPPLGRHHLARAS